MEARDNGRSTIDGNWRVCVSECQRGQSATNLNELSSRFFKILGTQNEHVESVYLSLCLLNNNDDNNKRRVSYIIQISKKGNGKIRKRMTTTWQSKKKSSSKSRTLQLPGYPWRPKRACWWAIRNSFLRFRRGSTSWRAAFSPSVARSITSPNRWSVQSAKQGFPLDWTPASARNQKVLFIFVKEIYSSLKTC